MVVFVVFVGELVVVVLVVLVGYGAAETKGRATANRARIDGRYISESRVIRSRGQWILGAKNTRVDDLMIGSVESSVEWRW